jgi:LPXTG-site transpeptidase (sortase) family protein
MTRPRPAILVLAASALALGLGTVGLASAGSGMHVDSVGARPSATEGTPSSPTATSGTASPDRAMAPEGGDDVAPGAAPRQDASPFRSLDRRDATELPRPDRTPRPETLRIPALDLRIPVDVVGLDTDGQVEVPADVRRTGWYRFSSKPGSSQGSTVIVGHRDGVNQGAGAFIDLGSLRPGDRITVDRVDGSTIRYEVVARESFDKDRVPLQELFSRSGPSRLTLITCGGPFDPSALGYTDNIVVTAVPVAIDSETGQTS